MPVGLMNGSRRARNTPSIANNTNIFGIMGGLAPRVGGPSNSTYRMSVVRGGKLLPSAAGYTPASQKNYMGANHLLSVNPCSGGIGRMNLIKKCGGSLDLVSVPYSSALALADELLLAIDAAFFSANTITTDWVSTGSAILHLEGYLNIDAVNEAAIRSFVMNYLGTHTLATGVEYYVLINNYGSKIDIRVVLANVALQGVPANTNTATAVFHAAMGNAAGTYIVNVNGQVPAGTDLKTVLNDATDSVTGLPVAPPYAPPAAYNASNLNILVQGTSTAGSLPTWQDFRVDYGTISPADIGRPYVFIVSNFRAFTVPNESGYLDDYCIYTLGTCTFMFDMFLEGYSGKDSPGSDAGGGAMRIREVDYTDAPQIPSASWPSMRNVREGTEAEFAGRNCRGFRIQDTTSAYISECFSKNCEDNAFYFASGSYESDKGCVGCTFDNCHSLNAGASAFLNIGGSNNLFSNCSSNGTNWAAGVNWNSAGTITFDGCSFTRANQLLNSDWQVPGIPSDLLGGAAISMSVRLADNSAKTIVKNCTFISSGDTTDYTPAGKYGSCFWSKFNGSGAVFNVHDSTNTYPTGLLLNSGNDFYFPEGKVKPTATVSVTVPDPPANALPASGIITWL